MSALMMKGGLGMGLATPRAPRRNVAMAAATEVREQTSTSSGAQEIYIGFPKGDYARPAGRKGRVIKDDPKKYPAREDLGPFLGAVGGWAGGEAGLWQLREQIKAEQKSGTTTTSSKPLAPSSPVRQPVKTKWNVKPTSSAGKDEIYVGFGKDEIELRKTGVQGRVIYDEAYKYPGRESIGFFSGVTGGFAGGEAALKQFAVTGELKLKKPGDPTIQKQFSPLTLAFLIVFAAAGGGVLLSSAFDGLDGSVSEVLKAPIDGTTKNLLLGGAGLTGTVAVAAAARAAVAQLQAKVAESASTIQRAIVTVAFLGAVFVAARAVLEN